MRSRGNRTTARSHARSGATIVAAAVAVAALTATGPAAARGRAQLPLEERVAATGAATAAPTAAGTAATAAAAAGAVETGTAATVAATTRTPRFAALYRFDQRTGTILDLSGNGHTMRRLSSNGGATRLVVHGVGKALAFPKRCTGSRCPRVVLQTPSRPNLNPGTRPFAFGAAVNLPRNRTSKGQNVIQKGYSAAGSQYKLQIDGSAGRPSCVLVDRRRPVIRIVRSNRSVADGSWHTVQCRRAGSRLTILIDGRVRGSGWVPGNLSVANNSPLSVGGKGVYADNDQFRGVLDDVWVRVG